MGREVRMVPADWQHPKYPDDYYKHHLRGLYIPLRDYDFKAADADWMEGFTKWGEGFVQSYGAGEKWRPREPDDIGRYTEYAGARPSPDDYMPDWPAEQRTHFMMYEDISEGTPISPAFATAEELARWLADTNASAFAGDGATYEQWLSMINRGWAPSAIMTGGAIQSGVAGLTA